MTKIKVALLYGGRSVEHGVSINSARNIAQYIDREKFELQSIGIDQQGRWFHTTSVDKEITTGTPVQLQLNAEQPIFHFGGKPHHFDVVFPLLHGTDGEDGSVQGLLQSMSLACVGSGVLGSALSMNKIIAKQLMAGAGLPVGKFLYFNALQRNSISFQDIKSALGLPFMVKSASLGSSVGVSKVKSESDFEKAVADSFMYDDEILFEAYIKGRELECAIMGNNPPVASLPGEIVINAQHEFYTFDAKYVDPDAVQIDVPAKVDNAIAEKIRTLSVKAFQTLRCLDYARVDLFLAESGEIFLNEINTIPGFTNSSMFPMMWKERGIGFTNLITRLIDMAVARHQAAQQLKRSFNSNLKY